MKVPKINIIRNLLYSVSANFITMFISIVSILVFPKILGVTSYGYYQLYLFYISFAGILHFGLVDGVSLEYAGYEYKNLTNKRIGEQFWILLFFEALLLLSIWIGSNLLGVIYTNKIIVIAYSLFSIILTNLRAFILAVLQSTNRILEYSKLTRIDRILFIFPSLAYLLFIGSSFSILLLLDLLCKVIALILGIMMISDIIFDVNRITKLDFIASSKLVFSGINLTLSFIASQLIIGIIRFGVEKEWSIVEFGKISLTLSLSNMFITFINAIGATLFPYLRRVNGQNLPLIYSNIRTGLMTISFGLLALYYPFAYVLRAWLPAYSSSITYMGILFPIFIYESKTSLLTSTFLKTVRGERFIFVSNIITLIGSLVLTFVSIFMLRNLVYATVTILVLLIFRSNLSEVFLDRKIKLANSSNRIIELLLTIIFVILNLINNAVMEFVIYIGIYAIFIYINRKKIRNIINLIKSRRNA